jgi:transmembrane sensor
LFDNSKHIDYLIARSLTGEASEAELQELNRWIAESEENRKRFEHICFVDKQAVASHRMVEVDVNKAWQKLHGQMKGTKHQDNNIADELFVEAGSNMKVVQNKRAVKSMAWWLQVAAVFVLVSGLAILLYQQIGSTHFARQQQVAIVSADSIVQHVLADSSSVTLNRNSRITYAANFGKKERKLALDGEAFFSVKHNSDVPFIVENQNTNIKVTGTSFNIKGNEADSLVEVYVKTGSVLFFTANNEGVSLVAGETGIFNKNRSTFSKTVTVNANTSAYANHIFVFYNTMLSEVFRQLSKVYQVPIDLGNPLVGQCIITVSFDNDDIGTMLSIIAETLDLTLSFEGDRYVFKGDGCQKPQN